MKRHEQPLERNAMAPCRTPRNEPRHTAAPVLLLAAITLAVGACSGARHGVRSEGPQGAPGGVQAISLPAVRVNQLGYLPGLSQLAVTLSDSRTPLAFRVVDAAGNVALSGQTVPLPPDATSGDALHLVNMSGLEPTAELRLHVGTEQSDPFAVAADLYQPLFRESFRFSYHMRSGVPIAMPHAEGEPWARPAGHAPDQARCAADTGCSYTLDVTGGWYDAGDQGKYVVNGGFSVWLLQNAVERAKALGKRSLANNDQLANIPESGNDIADLLDEARFELEFLLKMQVPAGEPLAGMAHHKMHDMDWTPLGTAPHEDKQPRILRPPSTAATLNLAAAAAQAARLWQSLDSVFAERALGTAQRAFAAALAHPSEIAGPNDNRGGGAYDDPEVGDELYWAAAEQYLSTGKTEYWEQLQDSRYDGPVAPDLVESGEAMKNPVTWSRMAALAKMSLALPLESAGTVPREHQERYRAQLRTFADALLATVEGQGYRFPMRPGPDGKYPWGSNADVLGNMVLLGSAADWEEDPKYLSAAALGMDYLLGRNAMAQSYVTGFGARPLKNPHHRFWAHQADARYPSPPPGAVSGGPNSYMQDSHVRAAGLAGQPPQKCFADHISAYSVNEVAINWNAAMVWATARLDEERWRQ